MKRVSCGLQDYYCLFRSHELFPVFEKMGTFIQGPYRLVGGLAREKLAQKFSEPTIDL